MANYRWIQGACLCAAAACGSSQPAPTTTPTTTTPTAPQNPDAPCGDVMYGTVHDLDRHDAVVAGATVVFERTEEQGHGHTVITDPRGNFVLPGVAQPAGTVSVYIADASGDILMPRCVNGQLWLGIHAQTSGERTRLELRVEAQGPDLTAMREGLARREAQAKEWLTFYEGVANLIGATHGDCAQMGLALEHHLDQNRAALAALHQQRAAMSSQDRSEVQDALEARFRVRTKVVQRNLESAETCRRDPRVQAALGQLPR